MDLCPVGRVSKWILDLWDLVLNGCETSPKWILDVRDLVSGFLLARSWGPEGPGPKWIRDLLAKVDLGPVGPGSK
jgi:hypothetical protein